MRARGREAASARISLDLASGRPPRYLFAVSLDLTPDGGIIEAPRKRGRHRTRFTTAERHAAMLEAAFAEIETSKGEQLVAIIARAALFERIAKGRGDPALERSALAIRERATKRLRRSSP